MSELVVNRWVLQYYYSLGLQAFQHHRDHDFWGASRVFESVLKRPYEVTLDIQIQIRLLHLLQKINEGESLTESLERLNCLESALSLLEGVNQDFFIQLEDYNSLRMSLTELIVVILVKNGEFKKAEEMLKKHFPQPMVGKKAIFMGLIKKKSKTHQIIDQVDFQHLKEKIVGFAQKICRPRLPFLCKVAAVCLEKRQENPREDTMEPDEVWEPSPSSDPQHTSTVLPPHGEPVITVSRLDSVYNSLAKGLNQKSFDQVKMEVTKEDLSLGLQTHTSQDAEQDVSYQGASCSPMEASPADEPAQTEADAKTGLVSKTTPVTRKWRLYTVAKLVVEPDSQGSSQCTSASEEEPEGGVEKQDAAAAPPTEAEPHSPITDHRFATPTRVRHHSSRNTSSSRQLSDEEEDWASSPSPPQKIRKQASDTSVSLISRSPKQRVPTPKTPPQSWASRRQDDHGDEDQTIESLSDSSSSSSSIPPQKRPPVTKWKLLFNSAAESKETWDEDEEDKQDGSRSHSESFSTSSQRRKMWTDEETRKLIEGVNKFGEGSWSKIRAYYSFKDRTNVNLKDRWRTMKKTNMI